MSMSEIPEWFTIVTDDLRTQIGQAGLGPYNSRVDQIAASILERGPEWAEQLKRSFVAGNVTGMMSVLTLDGVSQELDDLIGDATGTAMDAVDALLGPLEDALDQLEPVARGLRQAADAAWALARTPASAAMGLKRAEMIASAAAMITGLPPVTAAWAYATNARQVLVEVSDNAGKAAKGIEKAWRAVVRTVDMIRFEILSLRNSVRDIARDSLEALAEAPGGSPQSAANQVFGYLDQAASRIG